MQVWDGLSHDEQVAVLAHELAHVAGIPTHGLDPSCASTSWDSVQSQPCPAEVAAMLATGRAFVLDPEDALLGATMSAAAFWNDALGLAMFVVL